jgi:hypothetical protein
MTRVCLFIEFGYVLIEDSEDASRNHIRLRNRVNMGRRRENECYPESIASFKRNVKKEKKN